MLKQDFLPTPLTFWKIIMPYIRSAVLSSIFVIIEFLIIWCNSYLIFLYFDKPSIEESDEILQWKVKILNKRKFPFRAWPEVTIWADSTFLNPSALARDWHLSIRIRKGSTHRILLSINISQDHQKALRSYSM